MSMLSILTARANRNARETLSDLTDDASVQTLMISTRVSGVDADGDPVLEIFYSSTISGKVAAHALRNLANTLDMLATSGATQFNVKQG